METRPAVPRSWNRLPSAEAGRTMRTVLMFLLLVMQARADQRVIVYLQNGAVVPERTLRRAEGLASGMFATLRIRIDWRIGRPNHEAITVGISEASPPDYHLGALARIAASSWAHGGMNTEH